jgi:hypothetical protein
MSLKSTLLTTALLVSAAACDGSVPSAHSAETKDQASPASELEEPDATEPSQTGSAILILLTGTEDGIVSGQSGCKISYTATNSSRKNIRFLSMDAYPVLSTDNPMVASAVEARGKVAVYPGKLARGESDDRNIGIAAARCDQLSGLKISNLLCGFESDNSCADQVRFENRTGLTLEKE